MIIFLYFVFCVSVLPPQILTSDGLVYKVTEGGNIFLHCESFGSPQPHVTWYKILSYISSNSNEGPYSLENNQHTVICKHSCACAVLLSKGSFMTSF